MGAVRSRAYVKNPLQTRFPFHEAADDWRVVQDGRIPSGEEPVLFDCLGSKFRTYYDTMQGVVRREVVQGNLARWIGASRRLNVLDVGCGEGWDATWLADLGHAVTGIDPSTTMLQMAEARRQRLTLDCQRRLEFRVGDLDGFVRSRRRSFDLVLAHGVIMYQDSDLTFLRAITNLVKPGGIVSLLTKNRMSLAYRAVAEGDLDAATRYLSQPAHSVGRLGVTTRGHEVNELIQRCESVGLKQLAWYGVKIFTDSFTNDRDENLPTVLELELSASSRDPYRQNGRLLHLIATRQHP